MKNLLILIVLTIQPSSALAQQYPTHVNRFKTYEIQYVSSKASIARVDKIFTPCSILANMRLVWPEPSDRAENVIGLIVKDRYFNKDVQFTYNRINSTTFGSQSAVNAIHNIGDESDEYKASRVSIYRALDRALRRQSWLDLYIGELTDENGEKVYGFFAVVDERNKELLVVGDGVCDKEHEN
jgi:hypothetical protein